MATRWMAYVALAVLTAALLAPTSLAQPPPRKPPRYVDSIAVEDAGGDVDYYTDGLAPPIRSQSPSRDAVDIRNGTFRLVGRTLVADARLESLRAVGGSYDPTFAACYVSFGFNDEQQTVGFSLMAIHIEGAWQFRAFKFEGFDSKTTEYPATGRVDAAAGTVHLEVDTVKMGFRPGEGIRFHGVFTMSVDESYRSGVYAVVRQYDEAVPGEKLGLRVPEANGSSTQRPTATLGDGPGATTTSLDERGPGRSKDAGLVPVPAGLFVAAFLAAAAWTRRRT